MTEPHPRDDEHADGTHGPPPTILCMIGGARDAAGAMVCDGDSCQLPPVVDAAE